MSTVLQSPPDTRWHLVFAGVLALASQLPVLADFSGSDSLAEKSPKWAELFEDSDRDRLIFQNSHLEYLHKNSDKYPYNDWHDNHKRAYLKWTPNKGTYDHDWFVQVYAHRRDDVSIGVVNTANRNQGYTVSITSGNYYYDYNHYHNDPDLDGFSSETLKGKAHQHSISSATDGYLRIHFDSKTKTLTGSWRTRRDWYYFKPFKIDSWDMDDSSRFTAVLIGGRYIDDDEYPDNGWYSSFGGSHNGYFSDFKCGPAEPHINLEQPAYTDLTDGTSKKSFGTATVGGRGIIRIFTIRNNGTAKLRDLKIMADGIHAADFRISSLSETVLEPGGSTTFRVTFKPKAAGIRKAAMHIQSNDPGKNPFDITLTGMGVK